MYLHPRCFCVFLFAFVLVVCRAQAQSVQNIEQGVANGMVDTVTQHAKDWVANGMDAIGNWALQTLFGIYDKYIGTFLIYIPNLASPTTYSALLNNLGAVNTANPIQVVLNILKITSGTGLFILIVGFVVDTGQRSSGLWNRFVDPNLVIGFVSAFLLLFGWPTVLSLAITGVTAMGYYVYNQNTLQTSGVLQGFQNIDITTDSGANVSQMTSYDFRGNFITIQGMVWNFIDLVALGFVILGFYNCYSAVSAGESQKASYRFFQAMAGIILILGMPTLVHVLISQGADTIGNASTTITGSSQTFSLQGLVASNGVQFPQTLGAATPNIGTAGNTTSSSDLAKFAAGLLKCGVAIWGLIICFAVIFAKFFQVLNLWVLFVLGPIFIGFLGHPATAPIFWGAARYFAKLLLYSLIWAITLVGLYLIPNINWGVETIGVNSLLTAVAVLAGLQLITNVNEFASLLTAFSGGNIRGDGHKEFTRDMQSIGSGINDARMGTFGALKSVTGEGGQALATAMGAAAGSVIPGVGTVAGAGMGEKFTKGMNAIAHVGAWGSKHNDTEGPVTGFFKKFASNSILKRLDKEGGIDLSEAELEKRQALAGYAKKLQRTKQGMGGSRGEGKEKRA